MWPLCIVRDDYVHAVESLPEQLSMVTGELTSQRADGWYTLANTSSSIYLKQAFQENSNLLEQVGGAIDCHHWWAQP